MVRTERPQKGNPHRLAIRLHTFPKYSISRFAVDGAVQVRELTANRTMFRKSTDVLFCADRAWDHKTETGWITEVEVQFQRLANELVTDDARPMTPSDHAVATDFYLLWILRHHRKHSPFPDFKINGTHDCHLSKDTEEYLEKAGVYFFRQDGTIPGRMSAGPRLLLDMDTNRERMRGTQWGLVHAPADDCNFLVPDAFTLFSILPISPKLALVAGIGDCIASFRSVAHINGLAVANAEHYVFGRNLLHCPILKTPVLHDAMWNVLTWVSSHTI